MRIPLFLVAVLATAPVALAQETGIILPQDHVTLIVGQKGRVIPDYNVGGGRYGIRWTTDRPDLVLVGRDGTMTGLSPGEASVTVSAKGYEAVLHVTVVPPPPARLVLDAPEESMFVGTSMPVAVEGFSSSGLSTGPANPVFDSSNPAVARVDASGRVFAESPGEAEIWAVDDQASGTLVVRVEPSPVIEYEIVASAYDVRTGDVARLRVQAYSDSGPMDETFHPAWFADRPGADVLTENGSAAFVAYEPGVYHVTALIGSGNTQTVTLQVRPRARTAELVTIGRGPAATHHTGPAWAFEGIDGRDYAYIGTYAYDRLKVWDVTDPANPVLTDSVQIAARHINDVKIHPNGRIGIITREGGSDGPNGIAVLDLSDPAHPSILSEYTGTVAEGVHSVWILGDDNLVYAVHDGTRDLHIIDISDPAAPKQVGRWGLDREDKSLHDVIVQQGYAFVSYGDDGLVILDAGAGTHGGTPRDPVFVSLIAWPEGTTHTAWYDGRYVFAADEILPQDRRPDAPVDARGTIHVIDAGDPENPHEVARYEVPEAGAHGIWGEDGKLFVGYGQAGLRVLDITGELRGDLYRQGREIAVMKTTDGQAFVPNRPMTLDAQIFKGLVYSADFNSGLWIMKLDQQPPVP